MDKKPSSSIMYVCSVCGEKYPAPELSFSKIGAGLVCKKTCMARASKKHWDERWTDEAILKLFGYAVPEHCHSRLVNRFWEAD